VAFRSALDDQADGADLDFAAWQLVPEGRDDRLGRLPRCSQHVNGRGDRRESPGAVGGTDWGVGKLPTRYSAMDKAATASSSVPRVAQSIVPRS